MDRIAQATSGVVLLAGRLAMAAIFVPSGFGKLGHLSGFAQSLGAKGFWPPFAWAVVGACVEFFASVCVVLGLKTRYAALLLVVFTAVAAAVSHNFWIMQGQPRQLNYIQFMKNIAIIGGFLLLFATGPGPLSLDRRGR